MIYSVPIRDIKDVAESGLNVRQRKVNTGIEDLAKSISRHGLLQPIVLRGTYGKPLYDLVVGQRRLLAHKHLEKRNIPAIFRPPRTSDFSARVESLVENVHRIPLNHADAAEAITEMYRHYNKSVRRVAQDLGLSEGTVREYIKIDEQASPRAKVLLGQGSVTKEDVKRVIRAAQGNMKKADYLLDHLPAMNRYDKERMADYGKGHPRASRDEILKAAKKPRYQTTVLVAVAPEVDKALDKAASELDMERSAVAAEALHTWLEEQGFL